MVEWVNAGKPGVEGPSCVGQIRDNMPPAEDVPASTVRRDRHIRPPFQIAITATGTGVVL